MQTIAVTCLRSHDC